MKKIETIIEGNTTYLVEFDSFGQFWTLNGDYHREHGPAVIQTNGTQIWMWYNKFHRVDGPAVISANGNQSWYYQGNKINVNTQFEFDRHLKLISFI